MKYYETDRLSLRMVNENDFSFLKKYLLKNKDFLSPWEPLRLDSFYEDSAILQRIEDEIINNENESLVEKR